jgi:hypothetical protein
MTNDDKNATPEAAFATLLDAYSPAENTVTMMQRCLL